MSNAYKMYVLIIMLLTVAYYISAGKYTSFHVTDFSFEVNATTSKKSLRIRERLPAVTSAPVTKPSILVAVATRDRIGYVTFTSSLLRQASPQSLGYTIVVFDDCSTQYDITDLQRWYGPEATVLPSSSKCGKNANRMAKRMFDYFLHSSTQDVVCIIDSDMVPTMDWAAPLRAKLPLTDGLLAVYNSGTHYHKSFNCEKGVCEKPSLGNAGTCMTRAMAEKMWNGNRYKDTGNFDAGYSLYFESARIHMMCLENSTVAHIGVWGQNTDGKIEEVALNFNESALEPWGRVGMRFYLEEKARPDKIYGVGPP